MYVCVRLCARAVRSYPRHGGGNADSRHNPYLMPVAVQVCNIAPTPYLLIPHVEYCTPWNLLSCDGSGE